MRAARAAVGCSAPGCSATPPNSSAARALRPQRLEQVARPEEQRIEPAELVACATIASTAAHTVASATRAMA